MHWWDKDADKSLLIGIFKHGYEQYNTMSRTHLWSFYKNVDHLIAKVSLPRGNSVSCVSMETKIFRFFLLLVPKKWCCGGSQLETQFYGSKVRYNRNLNGLQFIKLKLWVVKNT